MALEGIHDAFIIDLGLPDMDGLDLIARCRAQGSSAPGSDPVCPALGGRARSRTGTGRRRLPYETIRAPRTAGKIEKSPT